MDKLRMDEPLCLKNTLWSEKFTSSLVEGRKRTPFGALLESQGHRASSQHIPCADVQHDIACCRDSYVPQEDVMVRPVPTTARGLSNLLRAGLSSDNSLRQLGVSAMTVPLSVPISFTHKPTVSALLDHVNTSPSPYYLSSSTNLHGPVQPVILATELATSSFTSSHPFSSYSEQILRGRRTDTRRMRVQYMQELLESLSPLYRR
jgi:hypothetical protein